MSSSSERRFSTASWMGLALCALRLATSARGRISWKASPLRTAMGRHLARKSTKPATAIKFNTSSTLTLLSEAIKQPGRPSPRTRAPSDSGEARDSLGAVRASHTWRRARIPAAAGPEVQKLQQQRRLGGPGGQERAQSLTWKHWVCRSAPRDACLVHRAQPLPGLAAKGRGGGGGSLLCTSKGFASEPWAAAAANPGAGGQADPASRERGGSGAQVPGSGLAVCPRMSAPPREPHSHHPRPQQPSRRTSRAVQPRIRSSGPVPLFRSPARSITPGGGTARTRRQHPRRSAVTTKSQSLSK